MPIRCITSALLSAFLMLGASARAQEPGRVRALLDAAADRFGIPRPILSAIAFNESRWIGNSPDSLSESCSGMPPSYGVMGLRDDEYFGRSLLDGTSIGISRDSAARTLEGNIAVGAYRLARLFNGGDRLDIDHWTGAIRAYPGIPTGQSAFTMLYLDGVLELLRRGWNADNETVPPLDRVPGIDRARLAVDLEKAGAKPLGADYAGAVWTASPNYSGRGGTSISAVTIHDTEGGFAASLSWLTSTQSQASAHYMVRSVDGYIVQMVRESDKAWHVRDENPYTIGIEHEGYVNRPQFFTKELYAASADLVRHLTQRHGIPLDRVHVKGHIDFPNNSHTDPGGWWDWPGYLRLVARAPMMDVVLDPFEDNIVGWWQPELSGSTVGIDTAGTSFSITSTMRFNGNRGSLIEYRFTGEGNGLARVFRSGHGNISDGLLNVGRSGSLSLQVNGDGSGNALELWFYDTETTNVILDAGKVTWTGWRRVSVPLNALGGAGPYRFHSIAIRWKPGAARAGRIGLDDLTHHIGASATARDMAPERSAERRPDAPSIFADSPFPEFFRAEGGTRVIDLLGRIVAEFDSLPRSAVGDLLAPGFYLLENADGALPFIVIP